MFYYSCLATALLSIIKFGTTTETQQVQSITSQARLSRFGLSAGSPAAHNIDAKLELFGTSGVPAMHAALLQDGKVIFLDKVETYTELKLDNNRYAFSSIYDPESRKVVPLIVRSNAFCSGGAFLADGRLVSVGGNAALKWLDPTIDDGLDAIRYFDLQAAVRGWTENKNKLASNRWYASTQTLADGTVFVASGSLNTLNVLNKSNNNPTYELLDRGGRSHGKNIGMDILYKNQPYWMYPFLHLLKDGNLFVFVSKSSEIFEVARNKTIKKMPDLKGLYRTYPNTGGSVMLSLTSANNYEPTIMICGGGGWQGINSPGEASCGLINPMSRNPQWKYTRMPEGRCMVEGILLLDGTVLWLNGAQRGAQGFGIADKPAFEALIYDPAHQSWTAAGTSTIARLYHSVALMLLDGTILIAGSNPNEMPIRMQDMEADNQYKRFPTEYRIERWTPPYLMGRKSKDRPTNISVEKDKIRANGMEFAIRFKSTAEVERLRVILYHGGFVTHALHMGQAMIQLDHQNPVELSDGRYEVKVKMPTIALAPGPYVIYVLVNGIPSIGKFVTIET